MFVVVEGVFVEEEEEEEVIVVVVVVAVAVATYSTTGTDSIMGLSATSMVA